jgi:hypothetical protein
VSPVQPLAVLVVNYLGQVREVHTRAGGRTEGRKCSQVQ